MCDRTICCAASGDWSLHLQLNNFYSEGYVWRNASSALSEEYHADLPTFTMLFGIEENESFMSPYSEFDY